MFSGWTANCQRSNLMQNIRYKKPTICYKYGRVPKKPDLSHSVLKPSKYGEGLKVNMVIPLIGAAFLADVWRAVAVGGVNLLAFAADLGVTTDHQQLTSAFSVLKIKLHSS